MNREDLKSYKYTQEWVKGRLEYIEEYKTNLTKITTMLSDMPTGSRKVQDNIAEKLAILMDNINDILDKVLKQNENQKKILDQLEKVEEPYRLILEKVYIQDKTLVTVASEMNYSYRDLCRNHGIALNKFDEI